MRINKRLVTTVIFVIILITLIIIFSKTFAGKRNPDPISEEDLSTVEDLSTTEEKQAELDEFTAEGTSGAEDIASEGISVVSNGTYSAAKGIKGFFRRLFALREIDAEYEEMKQRIIQLELEQDYADELRDENSRLQRLLGFVEEYPEYEYVHAKVIASDPNNYFVEFTINRGEEHGIVINSAVVNEDGLVGRVIDVYPTTSKVLSIIDLQSAAPVVSERSRDNGVAVGINSTDSTTPSIKMKYLLNDADLVPGDKIVTSSLLEIFPKGISVGEVNEVNNGSNTEKYAIIYPSVDFAHLENVLIIVGRSNQEIIDESGIEEEIAEEIAEEAETENAENENEENNSGDTE